MDHSDKPMFCYVHSRGTSNHWTNMKILYFPFDIFIANFGGHAFDQCIGLV